MSKRIACTCAVAALVTFSSAWAQSTTAGHANYQEMEFSSFDTYTNSPDATMQYWMSTHFQWWGVFAPYFNTDTAWYTKGMVYQDFYAIFPGSALLAAHPDWVLKDQNGNQLYLQWNCGGGTCPEYAGDIGNPAFRANWIANAKTAMSGGTYAGLWIDDVTMDFGVCNGAGVETAPIDFATGQPMTWLAWRTYVANFATQIRQAFPTSQLVENSPWFSGVPGILDADPLVQQQLKTATTINLEQGIQEGDYSGGTGTYSIYSYLNFVDKAHQMGVSVTHQQYAINPAQQQYGLAAYFLASDGTDRIGDMTVTPDNWFNGYDVQLGAPLHTRTYANGIFQRNFTNGIVLLGEPGMTTRTVDLPGVFTTLSGTQVTSVSVSALQGIILTGSTVNAPYANVRQISSIPYQYSFQSVGTLHENTSVAGNPIKLNNFVYTQGLGTHGYSEIHYDLWGNCSTFNAIAGIDDEVPAGLGSANFQVWADGVQLYDSGTLMSGSLAAQVIVDLTGRQVLNLVVTNGYYMAAPGNVPNDDADWANATVTCSH